MVVEEVAMGEAMVPPTSAWSPIQFLGCLLDLIRLKGLLHLLRYSCYYGRMYVTTGACLRALSKNT